MNYRIAAPLFLLPFAAGCMPVDEGLGGAARHNIAVQTINPDPTYSGEAMEGGNGERGAKAVARYLKGEVKQPAAISTTAGSGGGGGRGAGAGAGNSSGG